MARLTYTERHCLAAIMSAVKPYEARELGYRGFCERVKRTQLFRCARAHLLRAAYSTMVRIERRGDLPPDSTN